MERKIYFMNKLLTKIVGAALGLTMTVGVGVAVANGNKAIEPAHAATDSGSVSASSGSFSGWTSSGLGSAYADGSAKFDSNGDNVYKTNLFSGVVSSGMTQLVVTVQYKINGTGAAANGVKIEPYVNGVYASGTTETGFSSTSKTTKNVTVSSGLANCTGFRLSYVKSSGNLGVYQILWTATYTNITFDSITLSGTYPTTFTQGGSFSHEGMIVTANYTGQASADVTSSASWSGYNMSNTGNQTVTVSYTDSSLSTTRTATYQITVNAPKVVRTFAITNDPMPENDTFEVDGTGETSVVGPATFYVLEFSDDTYGPAAISWNSEDGLTYDHMPCEDAGGGYVEPSFTKNGTFTLYLSYPGESDLVIHYHVSGFPNVTYVTDTLNNATTGISGTEYHDWSGKDKTITGIESDAVYAGQSAGGNTSIQLRSNNNNSGVITTASSGGVATQIVITFNSSSADSRRVDVYGKNTSYSAPTDLYSDSKGTLVGSAIYDKNGSGETEYIIEPASSATEFSFIGIRSNDGAVYIASIEITWKIEQEIIDTLNSVTIDVSGIEKTTGYYVGQTILLDGIDVIANFETAGNVSVWNSSKLEYDYSPKTVASSGTTVVTVSATYDGMDADDETFEITASEDEVASMSWGSRGYNNSSYFYAGTTLGSNIDTSKWTFDLTWKSGIVKQNPTFGTGNDNVHVGIYSTPAPSSEGTALSSSYQFQNSDDGKYLVAYYGGVFSSNNVALNITEVLNSGIIEPASGDPGYYLVRDASNLTSGDTIAIVASEYNYAMSTTQNSNNRGSVEITKTNDELTVNSNVQLFTLETGNKSGTWSFKT